MTNCVQKFNFQKVKKILIWILGQKLMIYSDFLYIDFLYVWFWILRQTLSKFNNFWFFKIFILDKITIFGAKIQLIQAVFACKNCKKSWLFSLKLQIQNFDLFLKEFLDTIWAFLTVCLKQDWKRCWPRVKVRSEGNTLIENPIFKRIQNFELEF